MDLLPFGKKKKKKQKIDALRSGQTNSTASSTSKKSKAMEERWKQKTAQNSASFAASTASGSPNSSHRPAPRPPVSNVSANIKNAAAIFSGSSNSSSSSSSSVGRLPTNATKFPPTSAQLLTSSSSSSEPIWERERKEREAREALDARKTRDRANMKEQATKSINEREFHKGCLKSLYQVIMSMGGSGLPQYIAYDVIWSCCRGSSGCMKYLLFTRKCHFGSLHTWYD